MRDDDCVALLRWALPRLRLRWPGFRRVRRQVCRRVDRRRAGPARAGAGRRACYPESSLKEVPFGWREDAFERRGELFCLRGGLRDAVDLRRQDLRRETPDGRFDLVLCRNLAFTCFGPTLQSEVLGRLVARLQAGGALAVGLHERPPPTEALAPWPGARGGFRRRDESTRETPTPEAP